MHAARGCAAQTRFRKPGAAEIALGPGAYSLCVPAPPQPCVRPGSRRREGVAHARRRPPSTIHPSSPRPHVATAARVLSTPPLHGPAEYRVGPGSYEARAHSVVHFWYLLWFFHTSTSRAPARSDTSFAAYANAYRRARACVSMHGRSRECSSVREGGAKWAVTACSDPAAVAHGERVGEPAGCDRVPDPRASEHGACPRAHGGGLGGAHHSHI